MAYQTAYLKYYYPREFMAALLTSVIDNPGKVSGYILTCRSMNIAILPPDINESGRDFTVTEKGIRYALTAIKSVGYSVIEAVEKEREQHGAYKNLKDFIERTEEFGINKRAVENMIKAGALDCFEGTRKQQMSIYIQVMESVHQEKKNNYSGQMSLFDLADEEQKQEFDIRMPDVAEYKKEVLLNFEKEVTGFYVSGHPLDEYEDFWKKRISATTAEFMYNDELEEGQEQNQIEDGIKATIGGMITAKTTKYTRNNKMMAFLTVEDLAGSVEVIVFPRQYEIYGPKMNEEEKVFITGKTNVEDEKDGKLILETMVTFEDAPKKLWIKFPSIAEYEKKAAILNSILETSEGNDEVIIYCEAEKKMNKLPKNCNIKADDEILNHLKTAFGEDCIRLV